MKILSVVGARPNFMKIAPIIRALQPYGGQIKHILVHTGQHYDLKMSSSFFADLNMPEPDVNLEVGSGSHAQQTAKVMMKIEPVLSELAPDLVVVVGDVNSTLACALTAKKLGLRVAHVEAGLRSGDMTMPEEINRLCTDAISDLLFTTDRFADANLLREGIDPARIHFVGNVMIDTLLAYSAAAKKLSFHERLGLASGGYATLTLHRPANVEDKAVFSGILAAVSDLARDMPIVFPIHPRTRKRVEDFGLSHMFRNEPAATGIYLTDPLGYIEFLSLNSQARLILTDSGGLQEETTILGIPCVTIRENTERPITVSEGTNRLAGIERDRIREAIRDALRIERTGSKPTPEKWDGKAAERIATILSELGPVSSRHDGGALPNQEERGGQA